jgi:hypothetical protein
MSIHLVTNRGYRDFMTFCDLVMYYISAKGFIYEKAIILSAAALLLCFNIVFSGEYADGVSPTPVSGTLGDPYLLSDADEI